MQLTPAERESRQRQLQAIKKMDDDALLIAYSYGTNNYPNIDAYDPVSYTHLDVYKRQLLI